MPYRFPQNHRNKNSSIIYLLYGGYTWLLVLQYFQEAVLVTSMFQGCKEGDLTLCNRRHVWFCIVTTKCVYLKCVLVDFLSRSSRVSCPSSLNAVSIFCLSVSPICLCFSLVFAGALHATGCVWVNVVKRPFLKCLTSLFIRNRETHKQLMLHLSVGQTQWVVS